MTVVPPDLALLARSVEAALDLARLEILPRYRRVATEWKPDGSPVTVADRAAEHALRAALEAASPRYPVVGEEFGGAPCEAYWLVDPIDGTIAYSRGIPLFATLVALIVDDQAVLGAVDLPFLEERYVAWRGGGTTCNGESVRCSGESDPERALVSRGDRAGFERVGEVAWYHALDAGAPRLRGYTDGFAHAMVLRGGIDAMVDVGVHRHDVAPLEVLVPEAGGRIVRLDHGDGRVSAVTGNPALVDWALALRGQP